MSDVILQLLFRRPLDAESLRKVQSVLEKMGAHVTGAGAVTLSARMTSEDFEKAFSRKPAEAAARSKPADDLTVPIPAELTELVESISQAPSHLPMKD